LGLDVTHSHSLTVSQIDRLMTNDLISACPIYSLTLSLPTVRHTTFPTSSINLGYCMV